MSNIKPSWKDAPSWAHYLAQDGDGSWYWYEERPTASTSGSRVWVRANSVTRQAKVVDAPDSWNRTLEHRP